MGGVSPPAEMWSILPTMLHNFSQFVRNLSAFFSAFLFDGLRYQIPRVRCEIWEELRVGVPNFDGQLLFLLEHVSILIFIEVHRVVGVELSYTQCIRMWMWIGIGIDLDMDAISHVKYCRYSSPAGIGDHSMSNDGRSVAVRQVSQLSGSKNMRGEPPEFKPSGEFCLDHRPRNC